MYVGTQRIKISCDRKEVYEIAETYPYFVRFFLKGSRILEQRGQQVSVEVHTKLLGILPTRWRGNGVKQRYERIDFTQTEGLFKGLKALWVFENVADGTVVSIRTSFVKPILGALGEQLLGKLVVERTTRRILSELKLKSESSRVNQRPLEKV